MPFEDLQAELVRSVPTDYPRHLGAFSADVTLDECNKVIMRDPSVGKSIPLSVAGYSRARWQSLELYVVPTPVSAGLVFTFTCVWASSHVMVLDLPSMYTFGTMSAHSFGSAHGIGSAFSVPCDFDAVRASSLIKPEPLEMGKARCFFLVELAHASPDVDAKALKGRTLLRVHVRGVAEVGGSS